MDLNSVVAPFVAAVTPRVELILKQSAGYTSNPDGSRTPAYRAPQTTMGSVQPLTFKDIQHVSGLNLNGTRRAIYLEGDWRALVRPTNQGGDLIIMPDDPKLGPLSGSIWLVALVLESWPDWTKVAVTLQNGS